MGDVAASFEGDGGTDKPQHLMNGWVHNEREWSLPMNTRSMNFFSKKEPMVESVQQCCGGSGSTNIFGEDSRSVQIGSARASVDLFEEDEYEEEVKQYCESYVIGGDGVAMFEIENDATLHVQDHTPAAFKKINSRKSESHDNIHRQLYKNEFSAEKTNAKRSGSVSTLECVSLLLNGNTEENQKQNNTGTDSSAAFSIIHDYIQQFQQETDGNNNINNNASGTDMHSSSLTSPTIDMNCQRRFSVDTVRRISRGQESSFDAHEKKNWVKLHH